MADNTQTNAGSGGDTFATDDIGGVKWPRVKVTYGDDGSATDASATNPLPVTLPAAQITALAPLATQPVSGTVTATVSNFPANQAGAADVLGTGSLTALNQAVTLTALNAMSAGYIQLAGTWTGSIQLEGSLDNFATSTNLSTTQTGGAAPNTNPLTANGFYRVLGVVNHIQIRARCSAFTSGTILVTLRVSGANGIQPVISTNASGFLATTTIDQTTPGTTNRVDVGTINSVAPAFGTGVRGATVQRVTVATDDLVPVSATLAAETTKVIGTVNVAASQTIAVTQATPASLQMSATQVVGTAATRWFAQISDGTTSPAIKAASTAAAATDPALVVAISPNNPVTVSGVATDANLVLNNAKADLTNQYLQAVNEGQQPTALSILQGSDFDGVDVASALLNPAGDLALNVNLQNASIPLPTLAATSTKQSDGSQKTQLVDNTGTNMPTGAGPTTSSTIRITNASDATVKMGADQTGTARLSAMDFTGTQFMRPAQSTTTEQSLTELLTNIMAANRATVHLLTQLVALARGQSDPAPGDEADQIIGEYSNPYTPFNNLPN